MESLKVQLFLKIMFGYKFLTDHVCS